MDTIDGCSICQLLNAVTISISVSLKPPCQWSEWVIHLWWGFRKTNYELVILSSSWWVCIQVEQSILSILQCLSLSSSTPWHSAPLGIKATAAWDDIETMSEPLVSFKQTDWSAASEIGLHNSCGFSERSLTSPCVVTLPVGEIKCNLKSCLVFLIRVWILELEYTSFALLSNTLSLSMSDSSFPAKILLITLRQRWKRVYGAKGW